MSTPLNYNRDVGAKSRRQKAAVKAQDAFWASIVESYPEIESGDLNPLTAGQFAITCQNVVKEWLESNGGQG